MKDLFETQNQYETRRDSLADQMKRNAASGVALRKTTSNLFRERNVSAPKLDVRQLCHVIQVDPKRMVAEVEGMTTYERLVAATLQYGCLPAVVPELNTITIGGAIAGVGIESSSFKYGLVHETVEAMEVLLSSGEVVTASRTDHADLFYGLPNTFGTLGYVLKVTIKLIPAKPFVKLRHIGFTDNAKLFEAVAHISATGSCDGETVDFMDASVFAPGQMRLTLGRFTDSAPYTSNYKYLKMYYRSIKKRDVDYLTASDYIWRWDPDWFWCSDRFGGQFFLVRLILGKWLLRSASYWKIMGWDRKYKLVEKLRKLTRRPDNHENVIQDVQVPIKEAPAFLDFLHENIGILPIWICPTNVYDRTKTFSFMPLKSDTTYINFGFWDFVVTDKNPAEGYHNRLIETELERIGGSKGLYSESFYPKDEFWRIYDRKTYDKLKTAYDPKGRLKDLYTKAVQRG